MSNLEDHDTDDVQTLFTQPTLKCRINAAPKKYILHVAATRCHAPNIALGLSDYTTKIFRLDSSNQLAELATFAQHTDIITEVKFSNENNNLVYTGSNDGTIRLWDLRSSDTAAALHFSDTTTENGNKTKQLSCFDISPNSRLLAAGTNLLEADAFILFWDVRKNNLLGGYWESHTDDITQVKFHADRSNSMISGSVDGLVNMYDLSHTSEEEALVNCLNTESSIEKLSWLQVDNKEVVACITHTSEMQFWNIDDVQPYLHLSRQDISLGLKRTNGEYLYIVNLHQNRNCPLLLAGSNFNEGECLRTVLVKSRLEPLANFQANTQRVRSSWFNENINLLLTGGEKGVLDIWSLAENSIS